MLCLKWSGEMLSTEPRPRVWWRHAGSLSYLPLQPYLAHMTLGSGWLSPKLSFYEWNENNRGPSDENWDSRCPGCFQHSVCPHHKHSAKSAINRLVFMEDKKGTFVMLLPSHIREVVFQRQLWDVFPWNQPETILGHKEAPWGWRAAGTSCWFQLPSLSSVALLRTP